MTLNITFKNGIQQQITQVRLTTVYIRRSPEAVEQYMVPELVIHYAYPRPQSNISLDSIDNICTHNS